MNWTQGPENGPLNPIIPLFPNLDYAQWCTAPDAELGD
jgi:hypothetical protein